LRKRIFATPSEADLLRKSVKHTVPVCEAASPVKFFFEKVKEKWNCQGNSILFFNCHKVTPQLAAGILHFAKGNTSHFLWKYFTFPPGKTSLRVGHIPMPNTLKKVCFCLLVCPKIAMAVVAEHDDQIDDHTADNHCSHLPQDAGETAADDIHDLLAAKGGGDQ